VSTDTLTASFDLDAAWQVDPQVSIRPERFGALLYRFGTRRLSFLKSPTLVAVVASLAQQPSARVACIKAGISTKDRLKYRAALATLAASRMISERSPCVTTTIPLPLVEQFQFGLEAPICLTWELTYACNLSCVHCLSSSGRNDPRELSTAECKTVIDELAPFDHLLFLRAGGLKAVTPNGILADPSGASAAEGRQLLDAVAAALIDEVTTWLPVAA
jgi:putative mycofactocin binding protein MftB